VTRRSCDGAGLLAAFRAAAANLEAHVEEVNALNVYPVPDGDTGSNMAATVRSALQELDAIDGERPAVDRVADAVSHGTLMGARGNSGVILSQILRGMAQAAAGKRRLNGPDLAHALTLATRTAYSAVAKPVEGTILSVIREAGAAAVDRAERDGDLEEVLTAAVQAAERAVALTPTQLDILREAGVVDAGGQGLYRLFQGALRHLVGEAPTPSVPLAQPRLSALVSRADEGFGYETMYLLTGRELLDVDTIRTHLESIGESVLVAGDARAVKIHVHNEHPDNVIAFGLSLGALSRVSVENLDEQARERREARAGHFASEPVGAGIVPVVAASAPGHEAGVDGAVGMAADAVDVFTPAAVAEEDLPGPGVVAVVAGDGLARVFAEWGVEVVHGGQSANPSTGELLEVCRRVRAREIILLPNNPNVCLAAQQAARVCREKRIVVVPTRNAAEGHAALLKLDLKRDAEANLAPMLAAARAVQTVQVTRAVRDARVDGRLVRRGQTIALGPDDGLLAAGDDVTETILRTVEGLRPGYELLALYYGEGADLDEAEELARRLGEAHRGVEIEVVHGGQPHYRYLISAE